MHKDRQLKGKRDCVTLQFAQSHFIFIHLLRTRICIIMVEVRVI